MHHRGDQPAQIELRVHFDGGVTPAIACPRKHGETEIDDRRVERIHGVCEVDGQRFVHVQIASGPNQPMREIRVDTPIASLVRIR